MQRIFRPHPLPRWVVLIYIASLIEAMGLAIYFKARIEDLEMAGMQPSWMEIQRTSAGGPAQSRCAHCSPEARIAQHASHRHDHAKQDDSDRYRGNR